MVAFNSAESAAAGSSTQQQTKKSGRKVQDMVEVNQCPEWLPKGWKVELKTTMAGSPNERKYWCYLAPTGQKFYSKPEVLRHLNGNGERSSSKQNNFSIGENSKEHVVAQANEYPEWLPKGWTVQLKTCKGARIGRTFKCYVDPSAAVKLYSKPEVLQYLESAKENSNTLKHKDMGTSLEILPKIDHSRGAGVTSKQIVSGDFKDTKDIGSRKQKKTQVSVEKVEPEELPPGWVSELKAKGKRKDWFHTDPVTGIIFRSRKDVFRYLETGEVSRHAIRPKNSSNNDSEIISNPLPSAAKMQELSDRATRRQLFSGNGNSPVNSSVPNAEGTSRARVTRAFSKTTDIVTSKVEGKGSRELSSLAPAITDETSIRRVTRGSAKADLVSSPAISSPQKALPLKIVASGKESSELRNLISPSSEGDTSTRRVTRGYSKLVSPSTNHPVDHIASSIENPKLSGLDLLNPEGPSTKRVTRGESVKAMVNDKSVEANEISDLIESAVPEPKDLKRKRADIVNARTKHVAAKKNPSPAKGPNTKQAKKGSVQTGIEEHITRNTRKHKSGVANQEEISAPRRSSRRLATIASEMTVNLNYGEPTQTPIVVAPTENNEDILALNMIVDSVAQWASQQLAAIPELGHKSSVTPVNQANEEPSNKSNILLENQSEPKFVTCLNAEKKQDDPENLFGTLPDDQTTDHNGNVEILESDKKSELNPEPQPSFVFGDSWADPCLEFAYKTLTGALPLDDHPEIQNYFQSQSNSTPMQIGNGLGVPKLRIPNTFETDDLSQCEAPVTPVFGQRSRSFMSIDVNLPLDHQESGVDESSKNHK